MLTNSDDSNKLTGSGAPAAARVPSGMDHDPRADEEVISQNDPTNPERVDTGLPNALQPAAGEATAADELANAIAFAIDGTGLVLPEEKAAVENYNPDNSQKPISEGITGAGLEDEQRA